MQGRRWHTTGLLLVTLLRVGGAPAGLRMSEDRMVFQTSYGNIEMAFYPDVAPITVAHILKLGQLGGYNTNHFFRVDKGFVAQTADVANGRAIAMDDRQAAEESKHVPLEVKEHVKHDQRGLLSMARHDEPTSGGSSFSITLGPAPHLDMHYTIFGVVTKGLETLAAFEQLDMRTEGIFVMPKERITIHSSYVYTPSSSGCQQELADLQQRFDAQAARLEKIRSSRLPGRL
ncbi:hypothetical protein WJX72_006104 [[Myrmecia] bisecta]|uniref:Peptidyl-prolyl cis-trans isomerase n=1 Tax=[Myrmecia] bisecta TaxID=41462 RepID=A0AAW1PWV7_9CHLO